MAMTVLNEKRVKELAEMLDYKFTRELLGHQSDALAYGMAVPPRMIVSDKSLVDPSHDPSLSYQAAPNHSHQYSQAQANVTPARWSNGNLYHMLATRLGWGTTAGQCPYKQVICTRVTDERVAVFIQTKDDAFIIDDGAYLFPSDALITQLRLTE